MRMYGWMFITLTRQNCLQILMKLYGLVANTIYTSEYHFSVG